MALSLQEMIAGSMAAEPGDKERASVAEILRNSAEDWNGDAARAARFNYHKEADRCRRMANACATAAALIEPA